MWKNFVEKDFTLKYPKYTQNHRQKSLLSSPLNHNFAGQLSESARKSLTVPRAISSPLEQHGVVGGRVAQMLQQSKGRLRRRGAGWPVLFDVVHGEQMLDEAGLDARAIGAVLAGEVSLAGDHAAAHLEVLAQIRRPGVHLTAARADMQARPDDREQRRLWKSEQGARGYFVRC